MIRICIQKGNNMTSAKIMTFYQLNNTEKENLKRKCHLQYKQLDVVTKNKPCISVGDRITLAGIRWIIVNIDVSQKIAMLLSEDIVCTHYYHEKRTGTVWAYCSLRQWLNTEFLNRFRPEEKNRIIKTRLENQGNEDWDTDGGRDTEDYIFVLSKKECERISERFRKIDSYWWIRTPGYFQGTATFVLTKDSHIDTYSYYDVDQQCGVRPSLWIDLEKLLF